MVPRPGPRREGTATSNLSLSSQTIEESHQRLSLRLSPVDPGISKAINVYPDVTEPLQKPEDLFPKPQRPNTHKLDNETPLELDDHDSKYNLEFDLKALNGFPNIHNYIRRKRLHEELIGFIKQQPTNVRKTVLLIGKSGFGKTQLATTYAQESKNIVHSATFLIDATTLSTLEQSFAFILREQLWEHWPKSEIVKPATQPSDDQTVRNLVHQWLSQPKNQKWLVIFDNVSDPDLLIPYLPPKHVDHGTVIITTQDRDGSITSNSFLEKEVPGQSRLINVGRLDPSDGEKLLMDIAGSAYRELETVTRLILDDLEGCAWKIRQFATEVRQAGTLDIEYRKIIEKTLAGNTGMGGEDRLFNTACERLLIGLASGSSSNRQSHQDAEKLLLLFSFFHPQDIWYGLVRKGQIDPGPPGVDHWLERSTRSPLHFKERIEILIERGFVAVDSVENIESARITIHDRMQQFLVQEKFYNKEILRFAASCVAYSNCGDYHPELYEIRTRLMPHVYSIQKHLQDRNEYGLRHFHFTDLEQKQQVIVERLVRDERDLQDDYIGYKNPFQELAYLLAWDLKTETALQLVEKAYTYLAPMMNDGTKSQWTVLIAQLLYNTEKRENYPRALHYIQGAIEVFSRLPEQIRVHYFAKRVEIALQTKWGSNEEQTTALKENGEVVAYIASQLPNTVYFLDTLGDSGMIFLERGLFELSAQRFSECVKRFATRLPFSHPIFVNLAAKAAINTVTERDLYLKTPSTEEEKTAYRRLLTRKAWEGFLTCLPEDDPATINQARILAWLYDEEHNLEECIRVRRSIVASLERVQPSDVIDHANQLRFLAAALVEKNSNLQEDDEGLFLEIKNCLERGLGLIQKAEVEKDEKVLAIQFRMACMFCEIYEYSAALPILEEIFECLKGIEAHSQSNMTALFAQLCDVYSRLNKRQDLENLLAEWTEPDISIDHSSSALETLARKARACMDYSFHDKAIPILENIQRYLIARADTPQIEVLENRFRIAECLELTNQLSEASELYHSILRSLEEKVSFDVPERLLKSRVYQGLGDVHESCDELQLAVSMFEKALSEVVSCEDRQKVDVRTREAKVLYSIAKAQWEIDLENESNSTVSASAATNFEKILNFQDTNGRWLLTDDEIGGTFYHLGFIATANNQPAEAERLLVKALSCFFKECPLAIGWIELSYHLLVRSLWEQTGEPESDNLSALFFLMLSLLAKFGIFQAVEGKLENISIAEMLASQWTFSNTMSPEARDLSLQIISELSWFLSETDKARQLAHKTVLRLLEVCDQLYGPEDWRSRSTLRLLEDIERTESCLPEDESAIYLSKFGYVLIKTGDSMRQIWSEPSPRLATLDDPLSDDTSKIHVRLGKWKSVLAEFNPELKDRLIYNPPPDNSWWPRSWTYLPNVLEKRPEKLDIPLRLADAPVIIPAPKRYPTVWSSIPPKDSHAPIDPSEPLSVETIIDILREYSFAQGFFLLLNRRLQIVVDNDFDYSTALAEKPIVFGGLKVDYVRNLMVHTSSPHDEQPNTGLAQNNASKLCINTSVVATKWKRPILGVFGKPIEVPGERFARIGVRVRPRQGADRKTDLTAAVVATRRKRPVLGFGKSVEVRNDKSAQNGVRPRPKKSPSHENDLLTIPTHTFREFRESTRRSSGILSTLRRFSERRKEHVKVFESETRHQIGTIKRTLEDDKIFTRRGILAPDISLLAPSPSRRNEILDIQSPIPKLEWISDSDWKMLKKKPAAYQDLRVLGADEIRVTSMRTNETGRSPDISIIGEGIFWNEVGNPDDNSKEFVQQKSKFERSISRCLLFRIQDWGSLSGPSSGTALYTTFNDKQAPALVGFSSFAEPSRDEGLNQKDFDGKDINDAEFSLKAKLGLVAFFGAWKLPPQLTEGYEIV